MDGTDGFRHEHARPPFDAAAVAAHLADLIRDDIHATDGPELHRDLAVIVHSAVRGYLERHGPPVPGVN